MMLSNLSLALPFWLTGEALPMAPPLVINKEEGISSFHGVHWVTLKSVTTQVEGIPEKVCPIRTFTFQLSQKEALLSESISLGHGDRIKVHSMPTASSSKAGGHKSYSPTNLSTRGEIDLTVKIYPNGINSQAFDNLQIGDSIGISGPWPPEQLRAKRSPAKKVNLVAFGVGLTEAIEVARSELNQDNAEKVTLLYANRYKEDAFFQTELEALRAKHPGRFDVVFLYSREEASDEWKSGRITAQVLQEVFDLPESSDQAGHSDHRFVVVGSKTMINDTWDKYLKIFGYNRKDHSLLVFDKKKMFAGKMERIRIIHKDLQQAKRLNKKSWWLQAFLPFSITILSICLSKKQLLNSMINN